MTSFRRIPIMARCSTASRVRFADASRRPGLGLRRGPPGSPMRRKDNPRPTSTLTAPGHSGRRTTLEQSRKTRVAAMRQRSSASPTRLFRQRSLPTKNCHAALRSLGNAIREYQGDSSSTIPVSFTVSNARASPSQRSPPPSLSRLTRSLHISGPRLPESVAARRLPDGGGVQAA
jgi:hypothetical protein